MKNKTEILTLPCGTNLEESNGGCVIEIYDENDLYMGEIDSDFIELFDELLENKINSYTYLSKKHRRIDYNGGYSTYLSWDDVKGWC